MGEVPGTGRSLLAVIGQRETRRGSGRSSSSGRRGCSSSFHAQFCLVFTRDMAPHCVVAGERTRTEGAGYADTLMPLPDVSSQVGLIAIQTFTERALQLLTCKQNNSVIQHIQFRGRLW